jgi:site-specific recombinase XerD
MLGWIEDSVIREFLCDAEARNLHDRTVYKYRLLFRHLKTFAEAQGIRFLKELDTSMLRKFRATWKDSNLAALKKLERLRSFFRFARESGWLSENPATKISNPKVIMRPTLPFSQSEMVQILAAVGRRIEVCQAPGGITLGGCALWCCCFVIPVCA